MIVEKNRIELKNLSLTEIENLLIGFGEKKYRALQIYNWMYKNYAVEFSEMKNIPKHLVEQLGEKTNLTTLTEIKTLNSELTGTKKLLFLTKDSHSIESVIIPEDKRTTLCISTQVGCPLDCKFCATGLMGYKRNLSVGEIVDQFILASKSIGEQKITNIVFMGMGEPLLNFDNVLKSLELFLDENTFGFGRNRIIISTSGISQKIIALADKTYRVKLALSLHSCFEDTRTQIMPINKKHSLHEVIEALEYYYRKTKNPITFEYIMLKDLNDREKDIKAITKLTRRFPSKINVIPFNSIAHMTPNGFSAQLVPTERNNILDFVEKLRQNGVTVIIRQTQGDDIAAACGQLAITN